MKGRAAYATAHSQHPCCTHPVRHIARNSTTRASLLPPCTRRQLLTQVRRRMSDAEVGCVAGSSSRAKAQTCGGARTPHPTDRPPNHASLFSHPNETKAHMMRRSLQAAGGGLLQPLVGPADWLAAALPSSGPGTGACRHPRLKSLSSYANHRGRTAAVSQTTNEPARVACYEPACLTWCPTAPPCRWPPLTLRKAHGEPGGRKGAGQQGQEGQERCSWGVPRWVGCVRVADAVSLPISWAGAAAGSHAGPVPSSSRREQRRKIRCVWHLFSTRATRRVLKMLNIPADAHQNNRLAPARPRAALSAPAACDAMRL